MKKKNVYCGSNTWEASETCEAWVLFGTTLNVPTSNTQDGFFNMSSGVRGTRSHCTPYCTGIFHKQKLVYCTWYRHLLTYHCSDQFCTCHVGSQKALALQSYSEHSYAFHRFQMGGPTKSDFFSQLLHIVNTKKRRVV